MKSFAEFLTDRLRGNPDDLPIEVFAGTDWGGLTGPGSPHLEIDWGKLQAQIAEFEREFAGARACDAVEWAGIVVPGCTVGAVEGVDDVWSAGYEAILNEPLLLDRDDRYEFCPACGVKIDYELADKVRAKYVALGNSHPRTDGRPTRPYPLA